MCKLHINIHRLNEKPALSRCSVDLYDHYMIIDYLCLELSVG